MPPHHGESICRCGEIVNLKVDTIITDNVQSTLKSAFNEKKIKHIEPQIDYILDKIVSVMKLNLGENYEASACKGYYGEEIDYVKPTEINKIENILKEVDNLSFNNDDNHNWKIALDFTLKLEYVFILEGLNIDIDYESTLCHVQSVKLSDIKKLNQDYLITKKDASSYYTNNIKTLISENKIMGVLLYKDGVYRLIDGYHRFVELLKFGPSTEYSYLVVTFN